MQETNINKYFSENVKYVLRFSLLIDILSGWALWNILSSFCFTKIFDFTKIAYIDIQKIHIF